MSCSEFNNEIDSLVSNRHIDTYVAKMSGRCRTIKALQHLCFAWILTQPNFYEYRFSESDKKHPESKRFFAGTPCRENGTEPKDYSASWKCRNWTQRWYPPTNYGSAGSHPRSAFRMESSWRSIHLSCDESFGARLSIYTNPWGYPSTCYMDFKKR